MKDSVILKPGKEKAIVNKHHWIFSGAIQNLPLITDGACLPVYSAKGNLLGSGYFNRKAKITGRMLAFGSEDPQAAVKTAVERAISMRETWFQGQPTNAYRLINGEGDQLPGLIVDRYGDVLVFQVSTLGMQRLLPDVIELFVKCLTPKAIYEKSLLPSRKEEGLGDVQSMLYGDFQDSLQITENGLKFAISIIEGQKTGFFLDHREMRQWIRQLSQGKRVLNCFSYTGGFSIYAAAGGAVGVDSVEISGTAMRMAEHNMTLNNLSAGVRNYYTADVFQFLREHTLEYDIVILDPPAFTKRQKDIVSACRGYKDINRVALQKMPKRSLLLTCSCSYHVDASLFQKVVFQASVEAKRTVKIIGRHRQAADHPINICHPESDYLKSLLLYVE
jgi:23S rRNA (cytosine1962-C5)-methyltransferase